MNDDRPHPNPIPRKREEQSPPSDSSETPRVNPAQDTLRPLPGGEGERSLRSSTVTKGPLSPRRRRLRITVAALSAVVLLGSALGALIYFKTRPAQYRPDEQTADITSSLARNLPPEAPKPNFTDVTRERRPRLLPQLRRRPHFATARRHGAGRGLGRLQQRRATTICFS